jgi:uncharacterized protein
MPDGGLRFLGSVPTPQPINTLIVKLAARCNMKCTYCYWFRDHDVLARPARMPDAVVDAFVARLQTHMARPDVDRMTVVLHGGEPLLFGKPRFARLCRRLREAEQATGTDLSLHITTNGILIDDEWAALFRAFDLGVTVSIDGPPEVHDTHRPDLRGRPTHQSVVAGIRQLRAMGIEPGVLSVCDPGSAPDALFSHLVDELDVRGFDVLIPDATHEDHPASVARFYQGLFDAWWRRFGEGVPADDGNGEVRIRFFDGAIRALAGYWSGIESVGYGPVESATVCTDGAIEVQDVCRIAGDGSTVSPLNVLTDDLDDIRADRLWQELWQASVELAPACQGCPFERSCGGGHIASRWSNARRFDNPSVYCHDLQAILTHIWDRVGPTLRYEVTA